MDERQDHFRWPTGTAIVYHVRRTDGPQPRLWQTHVFFWTTAEFPVTAAYRWNDQGTEATLVNETASHAEKEWTWVFPGPGEHIAALGSMPGYPFDLTPRNVAGGDMVKSLTAPLPTDHWIALSDSAAPLTQRVRSALDAHCACCHQPGGMGRAHFDARISTPIAEQGLVNGPLLSGEQSLVGAKVVIPAQPEKSMLYHRLSLPVGHPLRMPTGSQDHREHPLLQPLAQWIRELK
jgi:hypothetical protein